MEYKNINGFIVLTAYAAFVLYLFFSGDLSFYLNKTLSLLAIISSCLLWIMAIVASTQRKIRVSHGALLILILPLALAVFSNPANIELNSYQPIKATSVQIKTTAPTVLSETKILDDTSKLQEKNTEGSVMQNYGASIEVTDDTFLEIAYQIAKNKELYEGRKISVEGKLFRDNIGEEEYLFIGRFWIWHCFMDARIVGFDLLHDTNITINEAGWYAVEGTLTHIQHNNEIITFINVTTLKGITSDSKPYVY